MKGTAGESNGPDGCEYMPPEDPPIEGIGPKLRPALDMTGVPSYPEETTGKREHKSDADIENSQRTYLEIWTCCEHHRWEIPRR